jgi:HAD superfamily hydrolase (TIGR01549 family)
MTALVVFDLDDTLIDTRNVLLPELLRRTAAALGVDPSRLDATGKPIDEVVRPLGPLPEERLRAAAEVWYAPDVPPLEPLPGARELLASLRGRIKLVLLTRGSPERQRRKIERSGLGPLFDEIVIRPIEAPGSKRDDLERLLRSHGVPPSRCAVVGDDPRDELLHAKALGCHAIRVPETPLAGVEKLLRDRGLLS